MTLEELREQLAALRGVIDSDVPVIVKEALEVRAVAIGTQIEVAEFDAKAEQRVALNLKVADYFKSNRTLSGLLDEAIAVGAIGISYKEFKDENGAATRNPALVYGVAAKPAGTKAILKLTVRAPRDPNVPRASKLYQNVATGEIQRLDGVYQDLANADERAKMALLEKADANYNSKAWRIKADVCARVMASGQVVSA